MTTPPLLPGDAALFLDFDGTLAPLQADPDAVYMSPDTLVAVEATARRLSGALALLSGRDVRDLSSRTPLALWRIGGHGLETCRPGETPPEARAAAPSDLTDKLRAIAAAAPGLRLEVKGQVFALHYRQAPERGEAALEAVKAAVETADGYKVQAGKMVIEAKPDSADKGVALKRMMGEPGFLGRTPIMVGDDTTDEDAFRAAEHLGGWAIKVGLDGASSASHRLASPDAVAKWLKDSLLVQDTAL